MSNHDVQPHPYRYEQEEFNEVPDQDYTYFDVFSYVSLPRKLEEQCLPDIVFDPFDMANWPTIDWADFEPELTNPPLETSKDVILHVPPADEHQDANDSAGKEEAVLQQVVLELQERTERLERALHDLQAERAAERETLCAEIESNVKKLEAWNVELKEMVLSLVEEFDSGLRRKTPR